MENNHYTNQNLIVQRNAELNDFRRIGKVGFPQKNKNIT